MPTELCEAVCPKCGYLNDYTHLYKVTLCPSCETRYNSWVECDEIKTEKVIEEELEYDGYMTHSEYQHAKNQLRIQRVNSKIY